MRFAWLFLTLAPLAAGCSGPTPQLPARGRVLVNGLPLRGGTVVFTPDEKRGTRGPASAAVVTPEGTFELANERGPGAVPGWHRVTIAPPPASTELISALERYRHPDLSGLEFEVRAGADNSFVIAIDDRR